MRSLRLDRHPAIAIVLAAVLALGAVVPAAAAPPRNDESPRAAESFFDELWDAARAWWARTGSSVDPDGFISPPPREVSPRASSGPAGGPTDPDGASTPPPAESGSGSESDVGSHIDPDG